MKFDVTIFPEELNSAAHIGERVEAYGFDGLWTAEAAHNPFLPLTLAATTTQRINLGTAIAVAFPRSPMVTAQIAWDLAAQSRGRFLLGLGTQVQAHIVKRFSAVWDRPVTQLREYIQALRSIWKAFQTEGRLRYQGDYYSFGLLTPFFNPGPIEHPDIPVYIAGVGPALSRLCGEIADGFHVHPLHTVQYLQQVVLPAIEDGARSAGRNLDQVERSCAVFVVTGRNEEEVRNSALEVKTQIAFYASTPSYRRVLELRGDSDLGERLSRMAREGKWDSMWTEISDDLMHDIAVVAPPDELPYAMRERYTGLLTRAGYYFPFKPEEETRRIIWEAASRAIQSG